jgi:hypothetical protein
MANTIGIVERQPIVDPTTGQDNYDWFIPDVPITITKTRLVFPQKVQPQSGKVVTFGVSIVDLGDTVPFSTNTIFGIETTNYVSDTVTINNGLNATDIITNGSVWVAATTKNDTLYYSTTSALTSWTKVKNVTFENPTYGDQQTFAAPFKLMPYSAVHGKFFAYRNLNNQENEIASSTNGIDWIEHDKNIPGGDVNKIAVNPQGHYVSDTGYYSTNGLDWLPLPFGPTNLKHIMWSSSDSKWVSGLRYFNSISSTSLSTVSVPGNIPTIESLAQTAHNASSDSSQSLSHASTNWIYNGAGNWLRIWYGYFVFGSTKIAHLNPIVLVYKGSLTGGVTSYAVDQFGGTDKSNIVWEAFPDTAFTDSNGKFYFRNTSFLNYWNEVASNPNNNFSLTTVSTNNVPYTILFSGGGTTIFASGSVNGRLFRRTAASGTLSEIVYQLSSPEVKIALRTDYYYPGASNNPVLKRDTTPFGYSPQHNSNVIYGIDWKSTYYVPSTV